MLTRCIFTQAEKKRLEDLEKKIEARKKARAAAAGGGGGADTASPATPAEDTATSRMYLLYMRACKHMCKCARVCQKARAAAAGGGGGGDTPAHASR